MIGDTGTQAVHHRHTTISLYVFWRECSLLGVFVSSAVTWSGAHLHNEDVSFDNIADTATADNWMGLTELKRGPQYLAVPKLTEKNVVKIISNPDSPVEEGRLSNGRGVDISGLP